jgi:hypothetical protein
LLGKVWQIDTIDIHSIGLTLVLVHASVDGMDNVRADGCLYVVSSHSEIVIRVVTSPRWTGRDSAEIQWIDVSTKQVMEIHSTA